MWANENEIESQCAQQIRHSGDSPRIHGVRFMPGSGTGNGLLR